jgi:hypothetical protein
LATVNETASGSGAAGGNSTGGSGGTNGSGAAGGTIQSEGSASQFAVSSMVLAVAVGSVMMFL